MNERDLDFLRSLTTGPGWSPSITGDEVLRHFEADDGPALARRLLLAAETAQDQASLNGALLVSTVFPFPADCDEVLIRLAFADWHREHEWIVWRLDERRSPRAIDALVFLAQWIPGYLLWDDNRALAKNAVHAIAKVPGDAADAALRRLMASQSDEVREMANARMADRVAGRWPWPGPVDQETDGGGDTP